MKKYTIFDMSLEMVPQCSLLSYQGYFFFGGGGGVLLLCWGIQLILRPNDRGGKIGGESL